MHLSALETISAWTALKTCYHFHYYWSLHSLVQLTSDIWISFQGQRLCTHSHHWLVPNPSCGCQPTQALVTPVYSKVLLHFSAQPYGSLVYRRIHLIKKKKQVVSFEMNLIKVSSSNHGLLSFCCGPHEQQLRMGEGEMAQKESDTEQKFFKKLLQNIK